MSRAVELLDVAGRRRSPAPLPDFHACTASGNQGQRDAADPTTPEVRAFDCDDYIGLPTR